MNLANIKANGAKLGLEAELNVQLRSLDKQTKDANSNSKAYIGAMQAAENCVELLRELVIETSPKPVISDQIQDVQ